ncbi:GTP-binding protein [Dehalococcoidales bacterium]|nr:GTP-binding protein [Dehalococcoidales bacterium]
MNVNIVIVGQVDHGKSTLIGRLLYDSKSLPDDKVAEIQKLLEEYKKRFEFAYFLDAFEEEFQEERTIDTTRVLFKGKNYYTIVDVPGHKQFIKNMLTGASHAQVGILVVSAPEGVQEQTRRHAFLLHMLGIKQLFVAINKMDLVDFREEIFQQVKEDTERFLSSLEYIRVQFIPISALEGDNVYKPSQRMEWYQGPTLIEALDSIEVEKVSEKPLRFVVQDTYLLGSEKVVVGRVGAGSLKRGEELVFQPSGAKGRVRKIKVFPGEREEAGLGDSIGIVTECEVNRGDVGGRMESPPIPVKEFLGEMVLLEGVLKRGDELELKCGTRKARCLVWEIKDRINSETGEVTGKGVESIMANEAARVVFKTEPMVMEKFSKIPELGRFILARKGKNIGAGVVLEAIG